MTRSLSSKPGYKDTPVRKLDVILHVMLPSIWEVIFFWLLPEWASFLSRWELKWKSYWPLLVQVTVLFPLLSYSWVCFVSKGQLFKILVRELPRKSIKCGFAFAFQNLSNPDLQRAQRLDVFEFPIPSVVCSMRGSFCTLKLCQVYLGFGEPSWETQVRLIVCPYSAVPKILHSGLDGATEEKKEGILLIRSSFFVSSHLLHLWFLFLLNRGRSCTYHHLLGGTGVNFSLICFFFVGTGQPRRNCKMLFGICLTVLGNSSFDNWSMTSHRGHEECPVMRQGLLGKWTIQL